MSLIKRLILAAALIAGVAPALAQVPPPVPALPDTERRTTYSITASLCACGVGFQLYGDSTDVANWLEVFVNGVKITQPGNWSITSPTGSIATIPRPITDAVLTFTAVQTGTIQIVGARRPRRASQFTTQPSARDFNQALTDIIAQNRETWDKLNDVTGRTVQAPPGETLTLLPALASRASQGACFNSGGNLTSCVSVPSSTIAAGNGILFTGVNPTTITNNIQAGPGIVFTGTNPIIVSTGGGAATYVQLSDYGITCDGVTDWHTQLQTMIIASAGKIIFIPAGLDCLTSTTLNVPSNTTITGGGREISTIRSTTCNPIFTLTNVSNFALSHFGLKGSDACLSWAASNFGAIEILQTAAAAGSNYNIRNMKFSAFNSTYWVYLNTAGSTAGLSNFTFSDNLIQSTVTDIPTDGVPTNNGNWFLALFTASGGNGRVENTIIQNNRIEQTGICFGFSVYGNQYKFNISNNLILNPGQTNSSHCTFLGTINAYGILMYDINADGFTPNSGLVDGNIIISPYASGIYMAGGGYVTPSTNDADVVISNNLIQTQTSKDDSLLPRGAIAITGFTGVDVKNNKCLNGFGCIAMGGQSVGSTPIVVQGNTCRSLITNGATLASCIRIQPAASVGNTVKYIIKGNYLELENTTVNGGSVIRAFSVTGGRFGDLEISDNTINAGLTGLDFSNQWVAGSLVVKNNKFGGVANSVMADMRALNAGNASISGNIFDAIAGVNGNALLLSTATNISLNNNKFLNRTSGAVPMFSAIGTCGPMIGMQFSNVIQAAQVAATSLGLANPSGCTLNYLDQVQNLGLQELGAAASKYVVDHWSHVSTTASTTHLEQRQLTGN